MYFLRNIYLIILLNIYILYCYGDSIINPWNYQDRLGLYDSLIKSTDIPIMGNTLNNPFQGFKLQLEWQNFTGRSEIINNTMLNENAWWTNMNYYFSVIPYLSAMNLGLAPQINLYDIGDKRICTTYKNCDQNLMLVWDKYFQYLIKIKNVPQGNEYDNDEQELLKLNWDGHVASVVWGLKIFGDKLNLLDPKEQKFASGFVHFIDIVAAINFNTNYTQILPIFQSLPPRMLSGNDVPPFIPDFTQTTNMFTFSIYEIDDLFQNKFEWDVFINILTSKTKNIHCREVINREFVEFTTKPTLTLIKLLINILKFKC